MHGTLTEAHFGFLSVELNGAHGATCYLEHVNTGVTLNRSLIECTLGSGCNGTAKCWLACACCGKEHGRCKSNLVNGRYYGTFCLCCGNACYAIELSQNLFGLLIPYHFGLHHLFHLRIAKATIAHGVDVIENYKQQVVVVATLVKGRYAAFLSIEEPFQCLARTAYASQIVL